MSPLSLPLRLWALLCLVATFLWDLVASSLSVARIVLSPYAQPLPAIVVVPVEARTRWGVALFAYCVSLTPGSTCLHVPDDLRRLYVHVLDARTDEEVVVRFKRLYERWILILERGR
jgi:multisubunit Na+/H+ antiporter MnhE subunit